eukprot:TRINITY_DN44519_c0_g1_i1.p1 TRINITY_DN44519_c0_g1~~TRINITY_DN44519_c0_g1_i1.p1  ORF type:complete len:315 (-),score=58.36 TRINITY_DN44519_c0_g1_i1:85-1029(-)
MADFSDAGPLGFLPYADRVRFSRQAFRHEGAKIAAEFYGRRPRRFSVLTEAQDDISSPPPTGTKRLRCLRHGEGAHNVFRAVEFAAGRVPHAKRGNFDEVPRELFDPALTATGEDEARRAQPAAEAGQDPELLVTSPLRRACKTCLLAFEKAVERDVPVVAHEMARECYTSLDPSIYDAHRSKEELAIEFPRVDFSEVPAPLGDGLQGDPNWWSFTSPCGCELEAGETEASNGERAWRMMCWIMDRPERDIVLSSHSLFLLALFHSVLDEEGATGKICAPADAKIFRTGELRTVLVKERSGPSSKITSTLAPNP